MSFWRRNADGREARSPSTRIDDLAAAGRVVDVASVAVDASVIKIGLGYGQEYWVVTPGYKILPHIAEIEGGMLIIDNGSPLADKVKLGFLKKRIQPVLYTFR